MGSAQRKYKVTLDIVLDIEWPEDPRSSYLLVLDKLKEILPPEMLFIEGAMAGITTKKIILLEE